jgi:hypothetical protein
MDTNGTANHLIEKPSFPKKLHPRKGADLGKTESVQENYQNDLWLFLFSFVAFAVFVAIGLVSLFF